MYYVEVNSIDIAKERVRHRVENGGHGIPDADIERRYVESLEQLRKVIDSCDRIIFYDNTEYFRCIAVYMNHNYVYISKTLPFWFENWRNEVDN